MELNLSFELKFSETATSQIEAIRLRRKLSLKRAFQLYLFFASRGKRLKDVVNRVIEVDEIPAGFDTWLDEMVKKYGGLSADGIRAEAEFSLGGGVVDPSRGVH